MPVKQKISISNDMTMIMPALMISLHDSTVPPRPAPKELHLEMMVTMFWPPGMALGQNNLTMTVQHRGYTIAKDGHDCGVMIPHWNLWPPWPPNPLLLLHIPFSSRKMNFCASTVKMNGAPTGTSDLLSIPTPMTVCSDPVSLPIVFPVTNLTNTVMVGMTGADFWNGFLNVVAGIATDLLIGLLGGKPTLGKKLAGGSGKGLLIKNAVSIATGVVKIVTTGEGNIDIGFGSPYGGQKWTVGRKKDGTWTFSGESSLLNVKTKREVDSKGGDKRETPSYSLTGQETRRTETDADGNEVTVVDTVEYDVMIANPRHEQRKYDKNGKLIEVDGYPVDRTRREPPMVDIYPEPPEEEQEPFIEGVDPL